ncbi:MAG: FAD-binding protein [Clostridiales bacterium]|nr:FAD-binding protein [Clostridiales bacterium]
MLRLHQIRLPLKQAQQLTSEELRRLCARSLKLPDDAVVDAQMKKRSLDARDKGDIHYTLTVDVRLRDAAREKRIAAASKPNRILFMEKAEPEHDVFSLPMEPWPKDRLRPVVVGAGPAGLFCALALAVRGARPILLERGQPVEQRAKDIAAFETDSILQPESNVLFGEGGAGAFSDGKLTCGLSNPHIKTVLRTLHTCGAPEEILVSQRPHIGTDLLRPVLRSMRQRILSLGGEVRFGCTLTGLILTDGRVSAVRCVKDGRTDEFAASHVYLAIGHSARDTYQWLYDMGLPMEQKSFAVGARIEHPQKDVNFAQYGKAAGDPALPQADYKLNAPTPDGRGVYTFCMCPGGQVIGATAEADGVNVNGMSMHARDGRNANAALLVGVRPSDFGSEHPLAGVWFQREMETAAFRATGGFRAPCQRVGDLLAGRATSSFGAVSPSYLPGVVPGEIRCCLPDFVIDNFRLAIPQLARRLRGFDAPDALLTAPETRSSAPLRMLRNQHRESPFGGLYPLGEGAGHAGGIVSAAVDGLMAGMEA